MVGLICGYALLSQVNAGWWIPAAVAATMFCSFFVQAGEGAVFAIVPLIKRRMTGQIAGMTGAYGNVGAVTFLTVLSFVSPQVFFMVIGGTAVVVLVDAATCWSCLSARADSLHGHDCRLTYDQSEHCPILCAYVASLALITKDHNPSY